MWLTLSRGISRLEIADPLKHWDESLGLKGIVFATHRYAGTLYAATAVGVFYLEKNHFFQIPAMLRYCDLVVTVDTSIMHFASLLGKPSVILMRQRELTQWTPLSDTKRCIVMPTVRDDMLDTITVDDVISAMSSAQFYARPTILGGGYGSFLLV